ncbi:MAG TPA: hypothetical protein VN176_15565 [Verrucomicrobiae bacterium]|jgi:hypothetical protein|nr:hypothetical protein [Verrucomicrobiae bacterium]
MSFHRVVILVSLSSLLVVLCGCGGGSNQVAPPPVGGFTNASLNGTYAFAVSGTNAGGFFTLAGSLQANGSGMITGGMEDVNSPGTGLLATNIAITGTYSVRADGRTTATIIPAAGSGFNNVNLDFVLLTSQHGLVVRFDNNASASGSIDQQTSSAFNLASLAGSFAFNIFGIDGAANTDASAGVFTADASGNITGGVQDTNDNGTLSTNATVPPAALAISNPSNGRGTLSITTVADGTRTFAYYVISANQIRLIETDIAPALSGDAFRQSSTTISGSFAFTVAGVGTGGAFVAGGIINTDGSGNVLSTSTEDVNNGGVISQNVALSGTYSVSGGRGTITLNAGAIHLAAYPSMNGIQLLEIDNTTDVSGSAFQQTGPFSNSTFSGKYGLNATGLAAPLTPFDFIAQSTADGSGHITGAQDLNNGGVLTSNLALTGTYSLGANGRSTGTLSSAAGSLNVIYYAASSSHLLFIEIDTNSVAVGTIQQQP